MNENLTITHPTDSSKTYTYGKRGRKPLWVQEWERENPDKVPAPKTPGKSSTGPVTGPKGQIWNGRGRKPYWVKDMEENQNASINAEGNRCWTFRGSDGNPTVDAFVVAETPFQALQQVNKTMTHPITMREFRSYWKPVFEEDKEITDHAVGCYQFDVESESWELRPATKTNKKASKTAE